MLKKIFIHLTFLLLFMPLHATEELEAWDMLELIEEQLLGTWVLSPEHKQQDTSSHKHPAVAPLVGTQQTGISFKLIGGDMTIQEVLLPNTKKEMVTMYHCKDIDCTQLKATHYCVKQNQPELIGNLKESTAKRIVFDCDMSTELCQSNEDHVHQIVHEISDNGNHLKTSYFSWKNQKLKDVHTIYHFDRLQEENSKNNIFSFISLPR
jgi:hypothetical protein